MDKIFLSVSSKEKVLGEVFSRTIDIVFEGKLNCSLLELKPGDQWKMKIKQNLNECNILVSFLTPFYIDRPWAYVEWAAFWFSENKHTILILPELKDSHISQLFEPFHDVQAAFIDDEASIRAVLQKIQEITGLNGKSVNSEGNKLSKELNNVYKQLLIDRRTEDYSVYKESLDDLPFYDSEIKEIALHFYEIQEKEIFLKISERIISEEIKYEIAIYMLSKRDFASLSSFIPLIDSDDKLLSLLKQVVYRYHQQDTNLTIEIIEKIKSTSENSIIIFIKDLVRNGLLKSKLFDLLLSYIEFDSSKRKIYLFLFENSADKITLDKILLSIESNVDRVNIAKYFAENNRIDLFIEVIQKINNNSELFRLFRILNERNCSSEYIKRIIDCIKNSTILTNMISYAKKGDLHQSIISHIENSKSKIKEN